MNEFEVKMKSLKETYGEAYYLIWKLAFNQTQTTTQDPFIHISYKMATTDKESRPHAAANIQVQTYDNHLQVSQEIHGGEQLDSDVDSVIDDHDNTIPYHQYQLNNEVESVPTDVSSVVPGGISVITILDDLSEKLKADNNALEESYLEELVWLRNTNKDLHKSALGHRNPMYLKSAQLCRPTLYLGDVIVDPVHTPFRVYDSEETLVQAEVSRTNLYDTFVPQKQLSSEQVYWLPANEVASYNCNQSKPITTFVRTRPAKTESVSKDIGFVVLTSDIVVPMSVEPRSNCVKEHSRNLELEAEILKMKQLLVEKEKRCSFIETKYQELELKFQKYKECFENPQVCNNSSSPELNVFFEINKLKDQIQGKDELIRKLKAQIGNMKEVSADSNLSTLEFQALETKNTQLKEELTAVRIKNDSLRDENVSIKKRYQDLYQSKAESNSNVSSRAAVPEKPKVLAPGLYAMTPKYIPPQKRNNREANTPLPRKETVSLVKQTNVCVNLSTGIKSVTEASKSKSKCETKTHRNLPARSENVKRVDNPLRSLNKRNRVDSSLSVKRTGFISKSVSVCKTCNECLVFGNHNKCGVKNLNSVNAKNPKVKNDAIVKQVWKATGKIFASVGSKWKPTGRKFTLGNTCPLTRITKPEVVPLEKSGSVSTSEPANNVIVTPSKPNEATDKVYAETRINTRTASIREYDTSVFEDLKALSWKTFKEFLIKST
ncbi:hypothetical protein Tco_0025583 [Tanacetum coccineum]